MKRPGWCSWTKTNTKELIGKIDEETGLVFVDKEAEELSMAALRSEINVNAPHAAVVLMTDPASEVTEEEKSDLVRLIVEKFIKSEG